MLSSFRVVSKNAINTTGKHQFNIFNFIYGDAKLRGLQVFAYTVDEVEDIKLMLACGVDGIFTNDPERTKHFLAQLNEL
jgi:glycerophosphoryl diester phosphodiesterase